MSYNTVTNNYAPANNADNGANACPPVAMTNCVTSNVTDKSAWPPVTQQIMSNAGLEPQYAALTALAPTNVSLGAVPTASSSYPGYPVENGNDGTVAGWSSAAGDGSAWWQEDLGGQFALDTVQVLTRQDVNQPQSLQNFEVWVSNMADMSDHTVACTLGAQPLPFASAYLCKIPAGAWRYVRVAKTDARALFITELRAFGRPASNIALGSSPSASASAPGTAPVDAEDGSIATAWAGAVTTPWLEIDLQHQHALTQVQLVTSQDTDAPASRANFQIWVSNVSDMNQGHTVPCSVGSSPIAFRATYTCAIPPGPWRYVAAVKTDSTAFYVAELRAFSSAVDLAVGTPAYASSSAAPSLPSLAVDADALTYWQSAAAQGQWWETDLGAPKLISEVQFVSRQDVDQSSGRANFQLWLSNSQDMSVSRVVICTQSSTPLAYRGSLACANPTGDAYRYVAVVKTDATPLAMGELRVYP